jgi:5'-nucleotidase
MLILLTNDDGIDAPGLRALVEAFEAEEPWVVAPAGPCSGTGQALGLYADIPVERRGPREWAVGGTPTDCVKLALLELLPGPPGLVLSGINPGPNMAYNIHYSGTVAAATEAAFWGIPAIAASVGAGKPAHLDSAAAVIARIVRAGGWRALPMHTILNVNVPDLPAERIGRAVWTRSARFSSDVPFTVVDPGKVYRYTRWVGQDVRPGAHPTDVETLTRGDISLTLLGTDRSLEAGSLPPLL